MITYEEIAEYAFMAFAAIAVIAGLAIGYGVYAATDAADVQQLADLADINAYVTLVMLILGIIVGLVSITAKEVRPFLLAAIALIVTGIGVDVWSPLESIEALEVLYYFATYILNYIVAFAAPAAVIISVKSIWALARAK